jgi:phospholipid/cholesterol/gamma-HCH transport system substrate-binding protein
VHFGEREDIGLGALTCLVGALALAYVHGRNVAPADTGGYPLHAGFHRSDGLAEGAPVRLAGVNVGIVGSLALREGFLARVTLRIDDGIRVPSDSAAVIHTDGLFGAKYIEIEPGGATENLSAGDSIAFTQDALVVDDLLNRLVAMAKARNAKCAEALAAPKPKPASDDTKAVLPQPLLPTGKGD